MAVKMMLVKHNEARADREAGKLTVDGHGCLLRLDRGEGGAVG